MAEDQDEKTEEATQSRRDEFRKRGQVAQTKELASALFMLFSAGLVYVLGRYFFNEIYAMFQYSLGDTMVSLIRQGDIKEALAVTGLKLVYLIGPVLGITGVIAIASSVMQVGFLQVEDAFSPNPDKINPIEGFKRVFSIRALAEGIKAFLKLLVISVVLYFLIKSEVLQVPYLYQYNIEQIIRYTGVLTVKLLAGVGGVMTVIAAVDYFFQRWELNKQMMMTKQEVKEEHKTREGDPMIKARIRRVQREVANRRMMDKVPKADVIITNPTHIAVALKYDENLPAPQVIAKGADLVAEKIKAIAKENNIPIVENKPLARTIYKTLKIGQVIPRELFVAVAEVLSYVYKLRRRKSRK
jgi:flagellar biosynthesis protein FlhB